VSRKGFSTISLEGGAAIGGVRIAGSPAVRGCG
jgi:hypothetical protein